ncbi:MAG: hydrolase 1, exosortase A system-associated [Janthinobacterium svalbardensis]|uniref:Hydrolase 1, exosortase A system-associated n=1 Tax=Janthinobacterium svalbardensis TaxID=368607 RepID=A0A290WXA9_9BURK|nr:hydrolase 1, exosortase A system-associated [Janthinobacterium svalbardensis]ATD61338.1 hydrolase 1, exosortase A system-associated [Janthinobacterium svalbardensis]
MKRDSSQQHLAGHSVRELPLRFRSAAEDGEAQARMVGILSLPATPGPRGILIVTGGPQYRVGSHRQFVLLARSLAAQGWPVLRFDLRGMGDSEGSARDYRAAGPDIAGALAQFFDAVPTLREVALWGLCDGATAAACHAPRDTRIAALILLNPWVRSSAGLARATLRHYYLPRLLQGAFWRKLASGGLQPGASLASLRQVAAATRQVAAPDNDAPAPALLRALTQFQGKVLLILSGDDLGAREWQTLLRGDGAWRSVAARAQWTQAQVAGANHTFASAAWRGEVERLCVRWLQSW